MNPLNFSITLTQHRREPGHQYQVGITQSLSQGASFWDIKTDLQPIYTHFNILSYFSSSVNMVLLDAKVFRYQGKLINVYQFTFNNRKQRYYLLQVRKDQYRAIYEKPGIDKLRIQYLFTDKFDWPGPEIDEDDYRIDKVVEAKIATTQFVVNVREIIQGAEMYEIVINVQDSQNWILYNIYPAHYDNRYKFGRISQKRKSTKRRNYFPQQKAMFNHLFELPARFELEEFSTDLQYFYLEPMSQRNKVISNKHLALALQGGGCKGATYIGAYKAIIDSYQGENIDITTVIGSSAGGIIGLAVCCKMSPETIIELCQTYLSRVTQDKTYRQKTPRVAAMLQKYYQTLQLVLRNLNIVDDQVIQILKNFLQNKEFTGYLFNLVKQISGLGQNTNVLSLFQFDNKEKNYCGILSGKLMTGEKVRLIAESCLLNLINSPFFGQRVRKLYKNLAQQPLQQQKEWARTVTMQQLYKITGVQFTCTSVDTTNHTLRFFNHKTTPFLPVVNAVQMTGAFPVAFQATYWKKQWGKYYIHYRNMRREVDLSGCKFTDGGMLANFPVDCIDNQDMRPMYFSHVKNNNTIMFGVGLQECPSTTQVKKQVVNNPLSWWKMITTAGITNMPSIIKQYLQGKFTLGKLLGIFNSSQSKQIDITNYDLLKKLSEIPLFDFLYHLIITYTSTKDNLAEQSFLHQSYQIHTSSTVDEYIKNRQLSAQNVHVDIQLLRNKLGEIVQGCQKKNQLEVLFDNLEYIRKYPTPTTQEQLLRVRNAINNILSKLMFNFLFVFSQPQVRSLLYQRVYEGYDSNKKSQIKQQLSQTNKIIQIIQQRTKLPIQDRTDYEELNKITDEVALKKYYFDRIFFQLELIKNCRLMVLGQIQKDWEFLGNVVQEAGVILREIFDGGAKGKLAVRIREISKQKGDLFIPAEYLKYQRKNQRKKFQDIQQKLKYPQQQSFQTLKTNLTKTSEMLLKKQQYNSKTLTWFTSDPYNPQQMLTVVQLLQQIPQVAQFAPLISDLIKNIKDNDKIGLILDYYDQIRARLNKVIRNQVFGVGLADCLVAVQECLITVRIRDVQEVNRIVSGFRSCVQLVIAYENYRKREDISSYIKRSVQVSIDRLQQQPQGFHVVMQSAPFSQTYFTNILKIIKQFKVEMKSFTIDSSSTKKYDIPITSITSSNTHSIASVLYASDLSIERVNQYCGEIKHLTYENQRGFITRIQDRLRSGEWAKKLPILLRDVTTLYTQEAVGRNVFAETETRLNKSIKEWDAFKGEMKVVESNNEEYKERISQLISESLSCVMDQIYRIDEKSLSIEDKLDQIANSLALKYKDKSYETQSNVKPIMDLVNDISHKYVDLLKCLVENSTYISEELVLNISQNQKKDAWKGLILGEVHSSFQIKKLVQQIMEESGLSKNTTLQEFHQACSKKITLNFSVISTRTNCVQIFNHYTRPYMPVWAAVLATSSLIQFFKPVVDRIQWSYQLVKNSEQRKIKQYFKQSSISTQHLYSADSLRRLPVDLLKNNKMCRKVYNHDKFAMESDRKEAYLIFNFNQQQDYPRILKESQRKNNKNIIKVENMCIKDFVKLTNYKGINISNLLNVPLITGNTKRLKLYMDSHDQLIINLYKKQLIMLPIRLGTLDFHLMCKKVNNEDKLSNLSNDSIMQSYYAMLEKIRIYQSIQSKRDRPTKVMYFRVESKNSSEKWKDNYGVAVRFLSKLVPNKSYKENYKIHFKEDLNDNFKLVDDEYIRLQNANMLYLKIQYVELRIDAKGKQTFKLKCSFYNLNLSKIRPLVQNQSQFGYVYCFDYTGTVMQQLLPQSGVNGAYNTDYILNQDVRGIKAEDLMITATLINGQAALKYDQPVCDYYHPLELKKIQGRQINVYDNKQITAKVGVPIYKCQTCESQKLKSEYSVNQKYQIKLQKDNSIKCTFNHPVILRRRLYLYPMGISFAKCDKCDQNSTLGFFKDQECNVDICFSCVFDMIKNQL